jgi:sugar phosphate isomerase/epimerase
MTTSAGLAGAVISPKILAATNTPAAEKSSFCVFTKCLQFLDYDNVGRVLAETGFDGADLAVRKGGQVEPASVKTDLPKAVKALKKSGVSVPTMVTDIVEANPLNETVLATAADLGITHYRLGYYGYDPAKSVTENLDQHKRSIEGLEKINRKYKIRGGYQNHSGTRVGGPVWDLYFILKDSDPAYIGVQYDIRHAVVEGAEAWPVGLRLLAPWISSTCIKDFFWAKNVKGRWATVNCPLGEGMVNFDTYLKQYLSLGIKPGPVSVHYEYDLGGAESGGRETTMSLDKIKTLLKTDVAWIRKKYAELNVK